MCTTIQPTNMGACDDDLGQRLVDSTVRALELFSIHLGSSLGLYTTREEIEYFAGALESILSDGPRGKYVQNRSLGEYAPEGFDFDFDGAL